MLTVNVAVSDLLGPDTGESVIVMASSYLSCLSMSNLVSGIMVIDAESSDTAEKRGKRYIRTLKTKVPCATRLHLKQRG